MILKEREIERVSVCVQVCMVCVYERERVFVSVCGVCMGFFDMVIFALRCHDSSNSSLKKRENNEI